jgi:hypothetical protein
MATVLSLPMTQSFESGETEAAFPIASDRTSNSPSPANPCLALSSSKLGDWTSNFSPACSSISFRIWLLLANINDIAPRWRSLWKSCPDLLARSRGSPNGRDSQFCPASQFRTPSTGENVHPQLVNHGRVLVRLAKMPRFAANRPLLAKPGRSLKSRCQRPIIIYNLFIYKYKGE